MTIGVRRFGVGHRRPEGPPGSSGVEGQVIHSDARGVVAELAFARGARVEPHANPNTTWFIVIEGGGWVRVADQRRRVAAGEAIEWPASIVHSAWTDHGHMRAIVVEFAGPSDDWVRAVLPGVARALPAGAPPVARGEGGLAERARIGGSAGEAEGEPA